MMPTWVRVLLTVAAGAWLMDVVIKCGDQLLTAVAKALGEKEQDDS